MSNTPSKKDVDDLVYALRQKGDDSTYALVVEALAKWGTPQPVDCTRSHPHEEMDGYCLLRTEVARLANENARLKVSQPVMREPQCWCLTCSPMRIDEPSSIRMALCPTCGNKRCPKANDHRNQCSNSNEPGQKGSAYEACGITQKGGQHGT